MIIPAQSSDRGKTVPPFAAEPRLDALLNVNNLTSPGPSASDSSDSANLTLSERSAWIADGDKPTRGRGRYRIKARAERNTAFPTETEILRAPPRANN